MGLGNPGRRYERTRHNVGFRVLDAVAAAAGLDFGDARRGVQALVAQGRYLGRPVILLKPMTYMNRSGEAVAPLLRFFRVDPADMLVVHDDLDVPFGRLKLVRGGGAGGHNGVRSVAAVLGTRDFPRLKVGIGRPPAGLSAEAYVLQAFTPEEEDHLGEVVQRALEGVREFLQAGVEAAMNRVNRRPEVLP